MAVTNLGLILAAGNGRRLAGLPGDVPKPLVQLHGRPLLEHVMFGAREAGIKRFVVVVGYRADMIRRSVSTQTLGDVQVTWVDNPEYCKDNGLSVLRARGAICEPFLLLMADHIFEPETAKALLRQPLGSGEVLLAVDHKVECIFDLEDATKVRREGDYIIDIGKEITSYDAVDTGMFLCSPDLFHWLESAKENGNCSLSDGVRQMGRNRRLRAFDIGEALWQDIDTPEMLTHARSLWWK